MTYDEYYEKLKLISQKQNNTSNSFKESSSTNDIKINLCIVEIGDQCKLLFDEDNEPIEITIKQAVPIYSPTWLGNHDQNSRRTTKSNINLMPTIAREKFLPFLLWRRQ